MLGQMTLPHKALPTAVQTQGPTPAWVSFMVAGGWGKTSSSCHHCQGQLLPSLSSLVQAWVCHMSTELPTLSPGTWGSSVPLP